MPTHKTEILGLEIEINYDLEEKEKLLRLIKNFNSRLKEFYEMSDKVSASKIIYLTALKSEDYIEEIENNLKKSKNDNYKIANQQKTIEDLTKEVISLRDNIDNIKKKNSSLEESNNSISDEISNIENLLDGINKKINLSNE